MAQHTTVEIPLEDWNDDDGQNKAPAPTAGVLGTVDSLQTRVGQQLASELLNVGRAQAAQAYSSYANIDLLRPYFMVEPNEVKDRLLMSLMPRRPTHLFREDAVAENFPPYQGDLYAPLMIILTLVTVLLYGLKASESKTVEGTLIGTAMAVSFGYWLGASSFFYVVGYVFNSVLTGYQILSLTGYGIFSYCIVLLTTSVFQSNSLFYLLWCTIGLLSALRMAVEFAVSTPIKRQGIIVGFVVLGVHFTYLLYLKFAYHSFYEALVPQK